MCQTRVQSVNMLAAIDNMTLPKQDSDLDDPTYSYWEAPDALELHGEEDERGLTKRGEEEKDEAESENKGVGELGESSVDPSLGGVRHDQEEGDKQGGLVSVCVCVCVEEELNEKRKQLREEGRRWESWGREEEKLREVKVSEYLNQICCLGFLRVFVDKTKSCSSEASAIWLKKKKTFILPASNMSTFLLILV